MGLPVVMGSGRLLIVLQPDVFMILASGDISYRCRM